MSMLLRRRKRYTAEVTAPESTATIAEPKPDENACQYQRSEIARMNTADLKELGKSLGLEVTEESTGKVLKEQILEKLGL